MIPLTSLCSFFPFCIFYSFFQKLILQPNKTLEYMNAQLIICMPSTVEVSKLILQLTLIKNFFFVYFFELRFSFFLLLISWKISKVFFVCVISEDSTCDLKSTEKSNFKRWRRKIRRSRRSKNFHDNAVDAVTSKALLFTYIEQQQTVVIDSINKKNCMKEKKKLKWNWKSFGKTCHH